MRSGEHDQSPPRCDADPRDHRPDGGSQTIRPGYVLYDEAVKHVLAGEFQQAEAKLLQAKKDGPAAGRIVLRYGSVRDDYFPDYYLGMRLSVHRAAQGSARCVRPRAQGEINPRDDEFKLIGAFEQPAKTALASAADNPPSKGGGTPPPPPAAAPAAAAPTPAPAAGAGPPPTPTTPPPGGGDAAVSVILPPSAPFASELAGLAVVPFSTRRIAKRSRPVR